MNHEMNTKDAVNDNMISKSRWVELAGLDKLEPTQAELAQDVLKIKAAAQLWKVELSSGKTMHVLSADGDLASLEQAVSACHGKAVLVSSATRVANATGIVTIADDAVIDRLCKEEALEEAMDRIAQRAAIPRNLDEQPGGVKVSFVTQQGKTIEHELTKIQAREYKRLTCLYGPSKRDEIWSQACKEACAMGLEGAKMFEAVVASTQRQQVSPSTKEDDKMAPDHIVETVNHND